MGRRLFASTVGAVVLVPLLAIPAGAAIPHTLVAADVGEGACSPSPVLGGQMVDCWFAVPSGSVLDPWGPHHADLDVPYDEDNEDHAACFIAGDRLECPGVFVYYQPGLRTVTPVVSGVPASSRVTLQVLDAWSVPASFSTEFGGEPYVFAGHPLRLWIEGSQRREVEFAAVRTRSDGRVMATIDVPPLFEDEVWEPTAVETGDLPPGRYLITPCLGASRVDCEEVAGGVGFQVGTGDLVEVIPGWNRPAADRINIVFAPSGDTTRDEALELVRVLLGWDGPLPIGDGDQVVTDPDNEPVWWVQVGPFAMEPLRSARHRFNLWMLDDVLAHPRALDHTAPPMGWDRPPPLFAGLEDVAVTAIDAQYPGELARSEALWPSFTTPDGPSPIVRRHLVFASAYVAVWPSYPRSQATTLAHEWGHALFDLRDEYVDATRGVTYGFPNCAPDETTAREWWGDLIGEIDPYALEYIEVLRSYRLGNDETLLERLTVGLVPGGCYAGDDDVVRPTADSLMNSEIPVFGAANRRRVEEVLALWTGREPFRVDAVGVSCSVTTWRERVGYCRATVAPFVDAPSGSVSLTVAGQRVRCDAPAPEGEVLVAACGVLRLAGPGPWQAAVGAEGQSMTVVVSVDP